ncbi:adenylosuccinate synthase [Roseiconus lacunae]|uniref:Adenylosuccinate synthetase n=1 Tax=Roseiconus lacunae TaxID=2605694 RepID=A0ABT7PCY0_9BACT|nr:adenylosuccinate synthase [Roseiconus lacunae]MCD0459632.1 adenylosuccinate synthase [Roseiconus lacunae]MDM4014331.1 adenylosuccinate synthase [Roseiconus lacunae]WRQ49646.1 adenylosuccinate synthase [Stieleria sp. HD01]
MSGTCVIGLQWGDEAKGKLVDLLAPQFDLVVRYQGGANAGHTVVVGDEVYKLHHIPSGILHGGVENLITPGVVINPETIITEMDGLAGRGIDCAKNMRISERAHLVMPWHIAEDRQINATAVRGESIGTTNRGIGPCYRDKVGRTHAIRMTDLIQPTRDERLTTVAEQKQTILRNLGASEEELESIAPQRVVAKAAQWAERLGPMIADTTDFVLDACEADKRILFEGAQGALLDIDHGTYPFVTSSNSSGVGVCAGAGVPPRWINTVLGVCKAYSTRVGGGPFVTELEDATGDRIRELGNEFGTTTGRPRRCGWFDAVAVRYTARLSGVTRLALMMMDVLAHLDELKICVAYELDGERITRFPSHADQLRRCKPIYETIPGWKQPVDDVRREEDFPAGALEYVKRVEELVGIPVGVLSVGPDRSQTIFTSQADKLNLQPIGA